MSAMTQPTSPLDRPLAITFFRDWKAQEKQEERLSLRRLMPRLAETTKDDKKHLPWLKLARFGNERTDKNSLRHNANVLGISGVEGDYDHEKATVDEACAMLRAAGLAGVIYTSPSHTEDAPRWRVLCPLSRDYDATDRASFIARLNGVFRGALSDESHTLSQSYYYGSVKRSPSHRVEIVDGDYLDRREDLDASAVGRPKSVPPVVRDAAPRAAASSAFIEAVIRGALSKVTAAGDGQKHHTLRAQAKVLGGFQHAGTYSQAEAVQWLVSALPASAKDLKAAAKTAAWGFEWGQANPLDVPPLKNNVVPFTAPEPPPHDSIPDEPARDDAQIVPPKVEVAAKARIEIKMFGDIQAALDTLDLVEDLLGQQAMSVLYGESNSGKTFFATHLALSIACGWEWFGRHVERMGVIYCALEGSHGIQNRVAAFRHHFALESYDIPFGIVTVPLDLCQSDEDAAALIKAIQDKAKELGFVVGLTVMDTLSRAMAGGNENAPDDMGALVSHGDKIRAELKTHLMWVHHSGKDAARGARGHSLLRAATDTEIEITADGNDRMARVTKQREYECNGAFPFALKVVELGQNARGKAITSCVVERRDEDTGQAGQTGQKRGPRVSATGAIGLRALNIAMSKEGALLPNLPEYPGNTVAVAASAWRNEYYQLKDGSTDTKKHAFSRAETELLARNIITQRNGYVWLCKQDASGT